MTAHLVHCSVMLNVINALGIHLSSAGFISTQIPHLNDFFTCGFPQFLQPGSVCHILHIRLLLGLFDLEHGGDMFLKNIGILSFN
jgi:hypothetical protein